MRFRPFPLLLITCSFVLGAREEDTVDQAVARVERIVSQAAASLRPEFRILAAQVLKERYPDLANKFIQAVLADVRSAETVDPQVLRLLTEVAPGEAIALLPRLKTGSDRVVVMALVQSGQARKAATLYRASFSNAQLRVDVAPLFNALSKEVPDEAKKLFGEMLAAFSFEAARPYDLYMLMNCAAAIAPIDPETAAHVYDRIVAVASTPEFGDHDKPALSATFQNGSARIVTTNSRDTLLVAAGSRLCGIAPDLFAKRQGVLAPWNLAGPVTVKTFTMGAASNRMAATSAESAISARIGRLRSLPDAERPKEVLELARAIEALPKGSKPGLAGSLANLATEGDNGKEAMDAVATALGESKSEGTPTARAYLELAKLIRYEHVRAPFSDPGLDASEAVLTLREYVHRDAGFSLQSMDGTTYSLKGLRGKVVLLNFWATWCPPCRKEMPDMEALYRRFQEKGLVVLAVSDEERETVAGYLAKQSYTFPILLDPGRKVNDAFGVEGIPKSFIFDAEGKLAAQAIDMRTERQFLHLLKEAGLQ